ncbi:MAG: HlyD family efflux transporter periplasmic adaptor subunit [Verrucomicrobia bacterium]|nr:HlyD family efflux transporter periplasmic adaptor subunit [Verrucomicrobiota bacterium]
MNRFMSDQPNIPTPAPVMLRELNYTYTPIVAFVIIAIIALALWNKRLGPTTLLGEAETIDAVVSSPQPGVLAEASKDIRIFSKVASGQIITRVVGADPKNPIALTAPIEGVITKIHRFPGDTNAVVAAGEPIMTVTAPRPDRIIAFLRQPLTFDPKPGMKVVIRPRARSRKTFDAMIDKVSPQLAPIRGALLPPGQTRIELGLPIIIEKIPAELALYAGEIVDLTIYPDDISAPTPAAK